jgi:uncharacterized coiled-coil protein SlyX
MPAKLQVGKAPAKPEIVPPTPEEKKKLAAEKRVKDAAIEQSLLKLGGDVGIQIVDYNQRKEASEAVYTQIEEEQGHSIEVVSQITQYLFATQSEYELRMSRLKERIAGLESQLSDAESELAALKAEKKQVLTEKDSVIENQKREMKEMAYQFSDMLMKTLITITEDFETQTSELGRDDTNLPQRERLKEFNLDRIRV